MKRFWIVLALFQLSLPAIGAEMGNLLVTIDQGALGSRADRFTTTDEQKGRRALAKLFVEDVCLKKKIVSLGNAVQEEQVQRTLKEVLAQFPQRTPVRPVISIERPTGTPYFSETPKPLCEGWEIRISFRSDAFNMAMPKEVSGDLPTATAWSMQAMALKQSFVSAKERAVKEAKTTEATANELETEFFKSLGPVSQDEVTRELKRLRKWEYDARQRQRTLPRSLRAIHSSDGREEQRIREILESAPAESKTDAELVEDALRKLSPQPQEPPRDPR